MEGFNPRRGNKSNFNEGPNTQAKISITTHDILFVNSFFSTITNSKKMISLIKGKKMSNHQSNCTKTNENNEDNNNNYNNNNKLNKYVDD